MEHRSEGEPPEQVSADRADDALGELSSGQFLRRFHRESMLIVSRDAAFRPRRDLVGASPSGPGGCSITSFAEVGHTD